MVTARIGFRTLGLLWLFSWATQQSLDAARGSPPLPVGSGHVGTEVEDQVADLLDSGEFSIALEVVRSGPSGLVRDEQLVRIARAQAGGGGLRAAAATLTEVDDDSTLSRTLREIGSSASQAADARGGGPEPDFDQLIDLIQSTIAPDTWSEFGGEGAIHEFAGGVYVDTEGVLRTVARREVPAAFTSLRAGRTDIPQRGSGNSARSLRFVSLPRLERQLRILHLLGREPTEFMLRLGGLEQIRYVLIYPTTGDLVLAGTADEWTAGKEGRVVGRTSGWPTLRLDDLVIVLRQALERRGRFGCSITPTQDGLARTQAFLASSSSRPLAPGGLAKWLNEIRTHLGQQTIEVFGVDPRTRVARVLVEADYHMKLVGVGLEEGVPGVPNYLELLVAPGGRSSPAPLDVLRWWFTLDYDEMLTTSSRDAFEICGRGVRVLSENELLTADGERVPVRRSDEVNRQFARNFTQHFPALCAKYPVYAELKNVFQLAMVAALVVSEDLPARIGWEMEWFQNAGGYRIVPGRTPRAVETVVGHRVVRGRTILAGASGGVSVDPSRWLQREAMVVDDTRLPSLREWIAASAADHDWWWDEGPPRQ
jgi:hypothetical protein